jgi:hypothetical protein
MLSVSHILLGDSPVWPTNAGEIIKLSLCSVTYCVLCFLILEIPSFSVSENIISDLILDQK